MREGRDQFPDVAAMQVGACLEEMLQKLPWANVFATGPEDTLHD